MEVTALCTRLWINVLVLLPAQGQHSYSHHAAFLRILPSRQQLFEYESIFINCEAVSDDLAPWRVMRNIKGVITICNNKWEITGSCNISNAFSMDTGEYWCEARGKKSNTVTIIVTAGPVILDSPALPVMEGHKVTLCCRSRTTSSNLTADFYKDGHLMGSSSAGEMIIQNVSKSDEGLYKCRISEVGESAESWLAVRANQKEPFAPDSRSPRVLSLPQMVVIVLSVALLLLLLLLGTYYINHKALSPNPTPNPRTGPDVCSSTATPAPCQSTSSPATDEGHVYYTIE